MVRPIWRPTGHPRWIKVCWRLMTKFQYAISPKIAVVRAHWCSQSLVQGKDAGSNRVGGSWQRFFWLYPPNRRGQISFFALSCSELHTDADPQRFSQASPSCALEKSPSLNHFENVTSRFILSLPIFQTHCLLFISQLQVLWSLKLVSSQNRETSSPPARHHGLCWLLLKRAIGGRSPGWYSAVFGRLKAKVWEPRSQRPQSVESLRQRTEHTKEGPQRLKGRAELLQRCGLHWVQRCSQHHWQLRQSNLSVRISCKKDAGEVQLMSSLLLLCFVSSCLSACFQLLQSFPIAYSVSSALAGRPGFSLFPALLIICMQHPVAYSRAIN